MSAPAENHLRIQTATKATHHRNHSWAIEFIAQTAEPPQPVIRSENLSVETPAAACNLDPKAARLQLRYHARHPPLAIESIRTGPKTSVFEIPLGKEDTVYGLGQGTGTLNRRGQKKELWNIDVLGHASCIHPNLRRLYQSIPFVIILRDGFATGLFVDDPGRQIWDLSEDRVRVESHFKALDLHLFTGPTVPSVLAQWTFATGRMPMPPRWALGYHQSRYSYGSREELEKIASEFRQRKIPCDGLHLDIGHMDGYRVFTFGKAFPKPKEMLAGLAADGFKVSAIVDPGVKDEPKFPVRQRGLAANAFVKSRLGGNQRGKVWADRSLFPDFFSATARAWWGSEQARFQKLGLAGFWNDMNEPAIFDGPGKTLPEDSVHQTDNGRHRHCELHNAYGTQMAAASRAGALLHDPDARPFILSRGGWAGIQRHSAVWTGDNSSCWEHLAESIPMLLNLGLSGVPFCGADVGGFLDDCTGELLVRWTQLGAFTPFFRNHCNNDSRRQEPWTFSPEVESICGAFISLRYQLMPYLYAQFARAKRDGTPIMRPLLWQWPTDPIAARCSDQFLLGPDLMIAPILQADAAARCVYLPAGTWHSFLTGETFEGGQHIAQPVSLAGIPIYVRGGGLIPMVPPRQFIDHRESDEEILLHVYLGGRGHLDWHEDDGWSTRSKRKHTHSRIIELTDLGDRGFLRFGSSEGGRKSSVKLWHIALHCMDEAFSFTANGNEFEPQFDEEDGSVRFALENHGEEFEIRWE
jgi:alpha-glucosidase